MANDAIALLEADNRRVDELFHEYRAGRESEAKLHLAQVICMELKLHSMVKQEIFFPAYAAATGDQHSVEHALKEADKLNALIARVLTAENLDGAIEAVRQQSSAQSEEERNGIFAKAKSSGMELATLGGRIQTRRAEVAEAIQDA